MRLIILLVGILIFLTNNINTQGIHTKESTIAIRDGFQPYSCLELNADMDSSVQAFNAMIEGHYYVQPRYCCPLPPLYEYHINTPYYIELEIFQPLILNTKELNIVFIERLRNTITKNLTK